VIVSIQGTLAAATPVSAIVEAAGLGYEVHVPVTTAERLPGIGKPVKLHTVAVYREDSQTLFGFATPDERDFFRLLVDHVSGVGPKVALTIMSRLALPVLRAAIADGDVALLTKCHGIGRKTAERLVVELKDKLAPSPAGAAEPLSVALSPAPAEAEPASPAQRMRDAILALGALGYKLPDADKAVRRAAAAAGPEASTEDLIKRSLAS
jgi:Holliday junction DNA helicase RuvA